MLEKTPCLCCCSRISWGIRFERGTRLFNIEKSCSSAELAVLYSERGFQQNGQAKLNELSLRGYLEPKLYFTLETR